MSIIIRRPRLESFLKSQGRRLLYGRRKTGKTFYARLVLPDYSYFIVRRGGSFYSPSDDEEIPLGALLRLCRATGNIIIDEFHRAPPRFFDAIHAGECSENLVLVTSTMHYYRRLVEGPEAPLQGLFKQFKVGLVSPLDLLRHRWPRSPELWQLIYYQEPMLIGWSLTDISRAGPELVAGLLSEVLHEEDYAYTRRYNEILAAVAAGRQRLSEIANWLRARGLLAAGTAGSVAKYLSVMTRLGLLERIPVLGRRNRGVYRHVSPLTFTVFYAASRYAIDEAPVPVGLMERVVAEDIVPRLFEVFVERALSDALGLRPVRIPGPLDIDVALAQGRTLVLVAEVKTGRVTGSLLRRVEEKLYSVRAKRRLLVVPDRSLVEGETALEVLDLRGLARLGSGGEPVEDE